MGRTRKEGLRLYIIYWIDIGLGWRLYAEITHNGTVRMVEEECVPGCVRPNYQNLGEDVGHCMKGDVEMGV